MTHTMKTTKQEKFKTLLPTYLKGLASGKYTLRQASESTGYSTTWLSLMKKRYLAEGFACLDHGNKNRIPVNKKTEEFRQKVAAIYASDFKDVNFAYYRKCLAELYDINVSYPTLASIMNEYGLVSPESRKKKRKRPAKRYRIRRDCEGDMLQIDGTPYPWFYKFGDTKNYCLVGAIDDATGKITALYMSDWECLYAYMEMLRITCKKFGVPREIYSDRSAIFCVTVKRDNGITKYDQLALLHSERTQWQRILRELCIRQILAWSPEAKGRVERMWRTIQGQLPQWFYLHKVKTMAQANRVLEKYVDEFNASYAKEPAIDDPFWIDAPDNLDEILECRIPRQTNSVGIFSFHSYKFEVIGVGVAHRNIEICISEQGVKAKIQGKYYDVRCLDEDIVNQDEDGIPHVLQEIIYRYLFAYGKEVSA